MKFLIDLFSILIWFMLASYLSLKLAKLTYNALDEFLYDLSCAKNGKYKRKYKKED